MIYISLGSNLGNRINNLRQAAGLLTKRYLRNSRSSIILETTAVLPVHTPLSFNKPFLNMVISGESDLSPETLLAGLKSIEAELGRPNNYRRHSPRIIDLDILFCDEWEINTPQLQIPHPELANRPFFLHLLALMGVESWRTAQMPDCFNKSFVLHPAFVGIVNLTNDSFSDGGKFNQPDKAIEQVLRLAADGASIIELGAQSTRPGAIIQEADQEYDKLKPVLDGIMPLMQDGTLQISTDTFWPSVIRKLLTNYPISCINDVKGELDDKTLSFMVEQNCKLCLMHSLTIPANQSVTLPINQAPMDVIIEWGKHSIKRLLNLGFARENIVLDPGIGFGKSIYQNIDILHCIDQLKSLGVQTMLGHSRKSYIRAFSTVNTVERDLETIAVSLALGKKVDFLRIHNVVEHMRFLATYYNFDEGYNVS